MRGFSLIELIVVMILMAILAAVAAPRFFGRGEFEAPAFAHELAAAARYAQKLAVTSGCPVRFSVPDAASYALLQPQNAPAPDCDTAFTRAVLNPGTGDAFTGAAPAGVAIAPGVGVTLPLTVEFRASGVPFVGGVEQATDITLLLGPRTVRIAARSGLVDVE